MRIAVLGGAGFMSSNLLDTYLEVTNDIKVLVYDELTYVSKV